MIKPLYNNVLLKKVEASNETKSGIIISQKETNEEFAVVAEVSGCKEVKVDDKVYEMPLKKGDKVMYKKYSGTDVKDGEQEYILIKAEDILAIVK
ncbi:MAG: co-chaperone GroES [Erysipelotrichaceae bacterium]|nr:co-chaperone GroES [Erysipelotrichaceae bacterium]MCR5096940.1 co-chaperone GroES [Erysipelotrichaceae bacterium]